MRLGIGRAVLVVIVLLGARMPSATAATARTWTGGGDGFHWSDAANWSGHAVPVNGDSVTANNATTKDDIAGLHLSSLTYRFGSLSGQRLVVDSVANASRSSFTLSLAAGVDGNWALNAYQTYASIDLNGHDLHLVVGPDDGPPPRVEGSLGVESITDTVGGGTLSQDADSQIDLFSSSNWAGTITGGRLAVHGNWSATSYDGGSVLLTDAARLNHVHVRAPTRYDNGLGVFANEFFQSSSHTPAEFQSLTMAAGSVFGIDVRSPPLVVDHYVNLDGPSLVLDIADNATHCPATFSVIDNRSASAVVGRFGTIKGGAGVGPPDPLAGKTLTAQYDAGDGNNVHVTCALAVTSTSVTDPTATTTTTTAAGPQLASTGGRGTTLLVLVALAMLLLGIVAVRVRRSSSWRAGA